MSLGSLYQIGFYLNGANYENNMNTYFTKN